MRSKNKRELYTYEEWLTMAPEIRNKRRLELRAKRKSSGLCVRCGKPAIVKQIVDPSTTPVKIIKSRVLTLCSEHTPPGWLGRMVSKKTK